jgi:hypothetical protein
MRQFHECNAEGSLPDVRRWRKVLEDEGNVHKGEYSEFEHHYQNPKIPGFMLGALALYAIGLEMFAAF